MDGSHINPADLGPDSGFEEFLASFLPPDQQKPAASEGQPEKTKKETLEAQTEEVEESPDESPEQTETEEESAEEAEETTEEEQPERKYAEDDVYLKVKVNGEEKEVAVKDLGRLYGQEAALTQKSQQVAEERKKVEAELAKNVAATNALLERAKARFEPYSKIDFHLAAAKLSPEEYTALRTEAMKAYEDVQFLEQHLNAFVTHINDAQAQSLRELAAATLKALQDPEKGIPGFDEKMYDEMRGYAQTNFGVPAEVINNVVDEWALRILHKAMLYDRGVQNKVKVVKVNKTPKKVVKSSTTPEATKGTQATDKQKALKKLQQTGTEDDAAAAFLASFADD